MLTFRQEKPHASFAGIVAAGLDGIAHKVDPGPINHDNLYEVPEEELSARKISILPATLGEALDALTQDSLVQGALGTAYAREYLKIKRDEWLVHNRYVTPWEREHYISTY